MTDVITKVSIGGQVYPFAGGGSEGQEVVYLTQAEYDALPASKLTDGKIYKVKTSGVAPTPGGGTAIERGDVLLGTISGPSNTEGFIMTSNGSRNLLLRIDGIGMTQDVTNLNGMFLIDGFYFSIKTDSTKHVYRTSSPNFYTCTDVSQNIIEYESAEYIFHDGCKATNGYLNFKYKLSSSSSAEYYYSKVDIEDLSVSALTQLEYDSIPSGLYYKGLYYSQDNNDYVAVDSTGTEVKRYSNIGTINGIYDDKLYRNAGGVAYAIATI